MIELEEEGLDGGGDPRTVLDEEGLEGTVLSEEDERCVLLFL